MRCCGAVFSAESAVPFCFQKYIVVKIRYTLRKEKKPLKLWVTVSVLPQLNQSFSMYILSVN